MRLIGRSYLLFALAPERPIADWLVTLDAWLARSKGFFAGRPVVLDFSDTRANHEEIAQLVQGMAERNVRVLGLEGSAVAEDCPDLPPLLRDGRTLKMPDTAPDEKASADGASIPSPSGPTSMLIETPIRSGQSVVCADGDITVLGSVGSGAEVVAGGSIHVYGTLRGRAMAGIGGNAKARIFCHKIEAELIAIDGYYMTADDIDRSLVSRPTQTWLDGSKIKITALN